MSFIWYIIIGIVAGFLAGKIMRGGGFGLVINLLLGIRRLGICPFRTCSLGIDRKFDNFYSGGYSCIMDCFFILKIQIGILYNLFLI